MAVTTRTNKETKKEAQGKTSVSAAWNIKPSKVTPENIPRFQSNIHYQDALCDITRQVYTAPPEIWVTDEEGEQDDALTAETIAQFEAVNAWDVMQFIIPDVYGWGASIISPSIEQRGGRYELTELRHLPAESFRWMPPDAGLEFIIPNPLLPGIGVRPDNTIEVWQTDLRTGRQIPIVNCRIIRLHGTPEPSGASFMYPCYFLLAMIDFAMQAEVQQVNRVGAPILLPKVSEEASEEEYSALQDWFKQFGKTWGKDTACLIPPGIEFPSLNIREGTVAQQFVNQCVDWIRAFTNPMAQMQQTSGTTIGSSDSGRMEMWATYIASLQSVAEKWLEELFDYILRANGYEKHHTHIKLKRPSVDRSLLKLQYIQTGVSAKAITTEEVRDNMTDVLELKQTTPELIRELEVQYPAVMSLFGNVSEDVPNFSKAEDRIMERTKNRILEANEKADKAIGRIMGWE